MLRQNRLRAGHRIAVKQQLLHLHQHFMLAENFQRLLHGGRRDAALDGNFLSRGRMKHRLVEKQFNRLQPLGVGVRENGLVLR